VRRLLRETKPRPATLRVSWEQQSVKGDPITVFNGTIREGGRRTMTVSLGQDPSWLVPGWNVEAPVLVYGGGTFGPVILCDGERLRVVRGFNVGL
jgi:hypothetical protein